jgi:hypothetical protein
MKRQGKAVSEKVREEDRRREKRTGEKIWK